MDSEASLTSPPLDPLANLYTDRVYDAPAHSPLLDWFRFEDRKVLDVGCGAGTYATWLKQTGVEVHGVTLSTAERNRVRGQMQRVVVANVETWEPDYSEGTFDAFLFSHVLEHLVDPGAALRRLSRILRPGGRVYVALPNIAYWKYRLQALRGRFDYEESGPMDRRHLRFFTFATAQKLVRESGYEILRAEVRGHLPVGVLRKYFPRASKRGDRIALRWFPNLFGYEIYVCASKRC